jgi:hypothetical protein
MEFAFLAFCVLCLVAALVGAMNRLWQRISQREWIATTGRVSSWSVTSGGLDDDQTYWQIHLGYYYDVGDRTYYGEVRVDTIPHVAWWERLGFPGQRFTREDAEHEAALRFPPGAGVAVRYNPRDPINSHPVAA